MYLLSLTKVDLTNGGAWLRLEESADLLRQRLGGGVEHVGVVLGQVDESCLGQDRLGPLRIITHPQFDAKDQAFLLDHRQSIDGWRSDQHQTANQFGSRGGEFQDDSCAEAKSQ